MRINPINNFAYINKHKDNKSAQKTQDTGLDSYISNPVFKAIFGSIRLRKASKFLEQDLSYDNFETRTELMLFCKNTKFDKANILIENAKSLLKNSTEVSNDALFAAHILLFGLNDGTLSKLENRDYISNLLRTIVEKNDHSLVLGIENPDDMELFLSANPEIDVNKHYYTGINSGYSILLKAAKYNNKGLLRYMVNRDDVNLYNDELWMHVLKHSERSQNLVRELPKEKFNLEQFEFINGYNRLMELLDKGYGKTVPSPSFGDANFEKHFRTIYDENGTFSLAEMERIVDYSNFKKFVNVRVSLFGDKFGHLLSEITINTPESFQKLEKIIKRLKEVDYPFFATNDLNQTPLAKAIESQNKPVEVLLRKYAIEPIGYDDFINI